MAVLSSGVCTGVKSYTVSCRSAWWPHKRESLESVCCRCCCWWCFCGCCCVCCYRGAWYQNACTEPRVFIHMCTHMHTHIHTRTHTHTQCGSRQQDEWRKVLMSPWTAGSWRTLLVGWWFNLGYSGSGLRVDVSVCRYRRYWCVFGNKSILRQTSTMRGGERLRILGNLGWCVCETTHKHTHKHTHTHDRCSVRLNQTYNLAYPNTSRWGSHCFFSEDILSGISGGASLEIHRFVYTPLTTSASPTGPKVTLWSLVVFSSTAFILFRIYTERVDK